MYFPLFSFTQKFLELITFRASGQSNTQKYQIYSLLSLYAPLPMHHFPSSLIILYLEIYSC